MEANLIVESKNPPNKPISLYFDNGDKKPKTTVLIEIGNQLSMFHDDNNEPYANIYIDDHRETWSLRSKQYKEWIASEFYKLSGTGVSRSCVINAVDTLSAKAKFESPRRNVFIRVANFEDKIYVDLCDQEWRVVEVSTTGWRVLAESPVRFIRYRGMLALPEPLQDGNISELWEFLNVAEKHKPLILGVLVSALRPDAPYPILVLLGEQGTAKSTSARVLRALIDPSTVPLRPPPKDERDFLVSAVNNWCVTLDNMSGMPAWLSDGMCRLATGGGYSARELYSDTDETLVNIQRPSIVNGIDDVATRPDFAERSVLLHLEPIPKNRKTPERTFWPRFDKRSGGIFGALLDRLATALKNIDEILLDELPRMADFMEWSVAAEGNENLFFQAYTENQNQLVQTGLESSPVGAAVIALLDGSGGGKWIGTPTDLHTELARYVDDDVRRSRAWPKTANWLSNHLRRLGSPLREIGIEVSLPEHTGGHRQITVQKVQQTQNVASIPLIPTQMQEITQMTEKSAPTAGLSDD